MSDDTIIYGGHAGGGMGKTMAQEAAIERYLRANPKATIVRCRLNNTRVEKHVEGEMIEGVRCLPPE